MTAALKRRARRNGFELIELNRIDGCRYLIAERHAGLVVRGDESKPLSEADVLRFLERFDDPVWIP